MQILIFGLIGAAILVLLVYLFASLGKQEVAQDPGKIEAQWVREHGDPTMVELYYKAHSDEERAEIVNFIRSTCPQDPGPQVPVGRGRSMFAETSAVADDLFDDEDEDLEEEYLTRKERKALRKAQKQAQNQAPEAVYYAEPQPQPQPQPQPIPAVPAEPEAPSVFGGGALGLASLAEAEAAQRFATAAPAPKSMEDLQAALQQAFAKLDGGQEEPDLGLELPLQSAPAAEARPKVCPHCGADIVPDCSYCIICGLPLDEMEKIGIPLGERRPPDTGVESADGQEPTIDTTSVPGDPQGQDDAARREEAVEAPETQEEISEEQEQPTEAGTEEAPAAASAGETVPADRRETEPDPAEAMPERVCSHCGALVPRGCRFCVLCGLPVADPQTAAVAADEAAAAAASDERNELPETQGAAEAAPPDEASFETIIETLAREAEALEAGTEAAVAADEAAAAADEAAAAAVSDERNELPEDQGVAEEAAVAAPPEDASFETIIESLAREAEALEADTEAAVAAVEAVSDERNELSEDQGAAEEAAEAAPPEETANETVIETSAREAEAIEADTEAAEAAAEAAPEAASDETNELPEDQGAAEADSPEKELTLPGFEESPADAEISRQLVALLSDLAAETGLAETREKTTPATAATAETAETAIGNTDRTMKKIPNDLPKQEQPKTPALSPEDSIKAAASALSAEIAEMQAVIDSWPVTDDPDWQPPEPLVVPDLIATDPEAEAARKAEASRAAVKNLSELLQKTMTVDEMRQAIDEWIKEDVDELPSTASEPDAPVLNRRTVPRRRGPSRTPLARGTQNEQPSRTSLPGARPHSGERTHIAAQDRPRTLEEIFASVDQMKESETNRKDAE